MENANVEYLELQGKLTAEALQVLLKLNYERGIWDKATEIVERSDQFAKRQNIPIEKMNDFRLNWIRNYKPENAQEEIMAIKVGLIVDGKWKGIPEDEFTNYI